jgi:hypothetical protein
LLVTAHAAFGALFAPFNGPETFPRMVAMGVIFAQPILLAAWTVFGPPPFVARVPLTIAAFFLMAFCTALTDDNPGLPPGFMLIMGGFFVTWAVILLILSKLVGWKILNTRQAATTGAPLNQFSLKYLLILMTGCAILLSVGRLFATKQSWTTSGSTRSFVDNVITPIGFISLAMIPAIVVPLLVLSRRPPVRVMVILAFAWAALTWLAVETIYALAGPPSKSEIAKAVVYLQMGAAAAGIISALVARYCGFRLIRRVAGKQTNSAPIP